MLLLINTKSFLRAFILCVLTIFLNPQAKAIEPALWQKLQAGSAVAIMRHAIAPGNGDPENFTLDDCGTQRNLSSQGQLQAQRIGELFKSNGVEQAAVYSSQWCRCIDTANGLDLGIVENMPILNSFYQERSTESEQTSMLLEWLKKRINNSGVVTGLPAVLVTHQVNITSLTGVYPASGEIVLVGLQDTELVVLGTFETH